MKTRNGLFADVPENLWNDWHWQVANRAETIEDLKKYMNLTPDEEAGVAKTLGKLRMAVTPYYLSLIDLDDPFDPIRKMAIPRAEELEYADYEDADPLNEDTDSPPPRRPRADRRQQRRPAHARKQGRARRHHGRAGRRVGREGLPRRARPGREHGAAGGKGLRRVPRGQGRSRRKRRTRRTR